MDYKIENGKAIVTLDEAEITELLQGLNWSDNEGMSIDGQVWYELDTKLEQARNELETINPGGY